MDGLTQVINSSPKKLADRLIAWTNAMLLEQEVSQQL